MPLIPSPAERITKVMETLAEIEVFSPELSEAWSDVRAHYINGEPEAVTSEERANLVEQIAKQFEGRMTKRTLAHVFGRN